MYVKAPVSNISRGSLHDGPGVRTVVYFKGCGLNCKWCHNPETLFAHKQILYMPAKCIHCGKCIEICPEHHKIQGNEMIYVRQGCISCGACAEGCPSLALAFCGEDMTVEELFEEIQKDSHYFNLSNGGVTFSGGECLLYSEFIAHIAKKCRENNIDTAVESAFFVPWENVEKVSPFINLFFADLKIPNSEKHREFTGQDNRLIIDNITRLSKMHNNIILRIPIIPGVNDSDDDIEAFAQVIKTFGKGIKEIELLKYNNLSESKYNSIGKEYIKFADDSQTNDEMKKLCSSLEEKCNICCYFV